MTGKIFFYVQHLLGIGHLVRAHRIARALVKSGFDVLLVAGGEPVPGLEPGEGVRTLQLPPVRAGEDGFSALSHPDGRPFTAADRTARAALLLDAFSGEEPDILLIEAFPFGRRLMRFELLPLLEAAWARAPRPLVASSIRDILQASTKPGRAEETAALVRHSFDLVLVHGEERVTPLAASFPAASLITDRLVYTGYVGPGPGPPASEQHDIIVSVGGGAVGGALVRAALAAARNPRLSHLRWLVLTGPNLPSHETPDTPPPNVDLRRFASDLPARLVTARVSVSQAGYNTVADVLAAGCAAVLVPFASGDETEQTVRASSLASQGRATMLPEKALTPESLADALRRELAKPRAAPFAMSGAERSARILQNAVAAVET